jgi:folate-binding Fe-S cluster repair protein YgfZ
MKNKTSKLDLLSSCAVCRRKLTQTDISLVLDKMGKTIFHVTCANCRTSSLISLSNGQKGLLGIGMITDLDRYEVKEKLVMDAISVDEIIEVYGSFSRSK